MVKLSLGWLGLAPKKWNKGVNDFLTGTDEIRENVSTLRPEQEQGFQNLQNASNGRGAGGAAGEVADYYRNNLSDNPADQQAFAAPQMRQYNEEIVPGISEQFAGMGAGGLSSSGFRNAQVQGGVDLSERLGAIRAGLRQNSAQGLQNITQQALQPYSPKHGHRTRYRRFFFSSCASSSKCSTGLCRNASSSRRIESNSRTTRGHQELKQ
jgi:hypothetical protein